jgi:hypothetical protein
MSSNNLRDCVKPEQLETFDRERWDYLVNPDDPDSRRCPGKWKVHHYYYHRMQGILKFLDVFQVEAEGTRICFVSSKVGIMFCLY